MEVRVVRFPPNPYAYNRGDETEPNAESRLFDARRPHGKNWPKALAAREPRCSRCGGPGPILEINRSDAGCLDCNLEAAVERATAFMLIEI